ncbi:ATP-binding protein [Patescibacteria group bacterium]|nr:ATP-binding protein [Patescibacteria group bacterium]
MKNNFILLIDGMTGAGKTTITKLLAKDLPRTAIVGMDKVKKFITDFERGERDNTVAKEVVLVMVKKYLELGLSVIVDQPFKNTEEIELFENLARENRINLYGFQLFTSPEIAFNRVVNRQKDYKDKVPEERIQRNISLFKNKEDLGFTTIDTSELEPKDVAELILKDLFRK